MQGQIIVWRIKILFCFSWSFCPTAFFFFGLFSIIPGSKKQIYDILV